MGGIDIVHLILWILIIGAICGLLWWLVGFASAKGVLPAPFVGLAQVIIAVVAVLLLINLLLGLSGHAFIPVR